MIWSMIYVSIILTAVVYDGGRNGTDFGKLGRPVNPHYQFLSEQEPAAARRSSWSGHWSLNKKILIFGYVAIKKVRKNNIICIHVYIVIVTATAAPCDTPRIQSH